MSADQAAPADAPGAAPQAGEDKAAAEWAAALAESKPESASEVAGPSDSIAPAAFASFGSGAAPAAPNDINMILDIPVQLTVELETLAGEPMDVLVNGYLIAQGEVVVVNDKFGIRLTDVVTPSERMRRLSKG